MKPILRLLATLALSLSAQAQGQFDLILPAELGLPGAPSSTGASFGILVNTGTEPLYVTSFSGLRHFSRTDQLWANYYVRPFHASSSLSVIQPGVAVGTGTPEMLALLAPEEWLYHGGTPLIFAREGPELPPAGPITCEVALRGSTLFTDGLERELRFDLEVHSIGGTDPILGGAQRIRSSVVAPLIEEVAIGCEAPIIGDLFIGLGGAWADPSGAPSRIGYGSNLPMLGNEHAVVHMGALYDAQYEGAVWFLLTSLDGSTLPMGGCDVLWPGVSTSLLGKGRYTHQAAIVASVGSVPLPIPDGPFQAGSEVVLQWLLLTPHAVNRRCAASPGMRLTLEPY